MEMCVVGLEGAFLREVQEMVAALTANHSTVIVDAATGAGETTLQIATAMKGGKLITVDRDPDSWHKWAAPLLKDAGVSDRVQFMEADIRSLSPIRSSSLDLVVSHSTLSALGIWAVDAIKQFHRVLKPRARLALADLLPEEETESDPDNISALSWRLTKAAAHLHGEAHYEELPIDWTKARLRDTGFEIVSFRAYPSPNPASDASFREWHSMDLAKGIRDGILKKAVREVWAHYVRRAEKEGMTAKAGYWTCWARKCGAYERRQDD